MRGKGTVRGKSTRPWRITPAYAGKRANIFRGIDKNKDHPRLCGEKKCVCQAALYTIGSPPPMRGKARLSGSCRARARITPAYAGKS